MTYIANAHQMRELDRRSIEELQIPGIVLMENAGRESVRFLSQFWPDFHDVEVTILAGKGNNGGDGFVVGRHLWNRGADVLIFLIGSLNTLHGDAKTNAQIAVNMGIPVFEIDLNSDPEELEEALFNANIIVDAIFGTGLTKAIEGKYSEIIDIINRSPAFTLSLDIPSGIFADRSDIVGSTVYANLTVTFGLPKPGLLLYPAAKAVGQLAVADISIPQELLIESELEGSILKPQDFHNVFLPRPQDSHKGTFGHCLVIAGSPGKTGAAALAAKAALIAGSGLVTVAVPERLHTIMECKLTEAMTSSIPSKDGLVFSSESLNPIIKMLTGKTSILLGPGLGTEPETKKFVFDLLKEIEIPIIIDADGLNALEDEWEKISALKKNIILTPHPGEMSRMVKMNTSDLLANQIKLTTSFSKRKNIYIVLKHARSLIATPDGNYFINITGNPGLASGGTGDILAGYIAGLSAQQYTAEESLLAGVFLHGLASDLAVKDIGEKELIASDILEYFSKARWLIESDPTPFQGIYVPYQFPDYSEGNFHD